MYCQTHDYLVLPAFRFQQKMHRTLALSFVYERTVSVNTHFVKWSDTPSTWHKTRWTERHKNGNSWNLRLIYPVTM